MAIDEMSETGVSVEAAGEPSADAAPAAGTSPDAEGPPGTEAVHATPAEPTLVRQEPDLALSLARYRRTAGMRVTGEWMQPFVARASFNLGFMYHFGVGVTQDTMAARRHYSRCAEMDPSGVHAPVVLMLALLAVQGRLA